MYLVVGTNHHYLFFTALIIIKNIKKKSGDKFPEKLIPKLSSIYLLWSLYQFVQQISEFYEYC